MTALTLPRLSLVAALLLTGARAVAQPLRLHVGAERRAISADLFGIFFEDLNWAADGGLYAELIQNRSFEYDATEQPTWNRLTGWDVVARGSARAKVAIEAAAPLHPHNPHYAVLEVSEVGDGAGLMNPGFDGLPITAGERYRVSLWAKQRFVGNRWTAPAPGATPPPLRVRLENRAGESLGETTLGAPGFDWTHLTGTLTATGTDETARFLVLETARGGVALDVVSLFPEHTFHDRANGLRADLAATIAAIHPRFMRFPGGCLAHGNGLDNLYRWKDTIGPIEQRREQANLWGYHQTVGLGYFEYFQFCEDIGAEPLPVIAAAVCCQNSDHTGGQGQRALPLDEMPAFITDILDLIEYANGPANSPWGAKRAAAGHPEPFHLKYLGIGNEDAQTPEFRDRFTRIYAAVKARHPEITVVGTVGPFPEGEDYEAGWRFARAQHLEMVDEHGYKPPQWFWDNLGRFDRYDRTQAKVYLGEYAAHDTGRRSTLRSALAEAAYLTALERNGDVVAMASYAPLLARVGHTQWRPDLIYFDGTKVYPTINYHVQQLFGTNAGDEYVPAQLDRTSTPQDLAYSVVVDRRTGDTIVKLVNGAGVARRLELSWPAGQPPATSAFRTVLAGAPDDVDSPEAPTTVVPRTSRVTAAELRALELPATSLTILRFHP